MRNAYVDNLAEVRALTVDELVSEAQRYLAAGTLGKTTDFVRDTISLHAGGAAMSDGQRAAVQRCIAYQWTEDEKEQEDE